MKKIIPLIIVLCFLTSFRHKPLTWIAIGDSITYLNDHLDETGNRVSKGYLTRVVQQLTYLKYINKGFNGWTAGNTAGHIDSLGLIPADIYSIFLGTNDWWSGRPVGNLADYKTNTGNATMYGSFRIIINKLHSLNPLAKIILITPMQRADFVYLFDKKNNAYGSYKAKNEHTLEAFVNALNAIGQLEHLTVVDLYHDPLLTMKKLVKFKLLKDPATGLYVPYKYPVFIGIPFNPETDDYPYPNKAINLTYDGLHPSDKGNDVIAKRLVRIMKNY